VQNNLSALGVRDQGRRRHQTVSTAGTEEVLKGAMRKEVAYRLGLCNTMHKQNITFHFNLLKHKDTYICRTAALTSIRYILNIYSTNIHTEYFKHAA